MSRSKKEFNNPQSLIDIIPHAVYNNHKIARKQIQNQREQTQLTIAYLERQAKRSVKQLESKQKSLLNYYQLKESRFNDMKKKEQQHIQSERKLQQQKLANESMRESSFLKRNMIKKQLENINKKIVSEVKSSISQSERKLSQQRQLQRLLLRKKNEAFTRHLINKNEHSRTKSQNIKRIMSSIVKNDLIHAQENIKEREIEKITTLKDKQHRLMSIVQKARNQHQQYDYTLSEVKSLPFEQISKKIKLVRLKGSQSRTNSRSDSLYDY